MKRKVKAKDMSFEKLQEVFDNKYNAKDSGLKLGFNKYCKDYKDRIEDSIVNDYKMLIKLNPEITDGQEMFEHWSYEWFKLSWIKYMSSSNKSYLI